MRAKLNLGGGLDFQDDEYASESTQEYANLMLASAKGGDRSRPGLRAFGVTAPTALTITGILGTSITGTSHPQVIALYEYRDVTVAVDGNRRIYTFDSAGVCTDRTSTPLPGNAVPRFIVDDDGRLIILGGGNPLVMATDYSVTVFVTRADGYSPQATHGCIVDRYLLLNDMGGVGNQDRVWYAAVDEHSFIDLDWFIRAGSRSDEALAIEELNNQLYIFGDESVEWWYGTGIADDPFRLERSMPSGLGAAQSLVKADNTLWWIDKNRRIVRLEGNAPKMVSLPVERLIDTFSTVSDCVAREIEISGKHLIAFSFETAGSTLVFDWVLGAWYEWKVWDTEAQGGRGKWRALPLGAYCKHRAWNRSFMGALVDAGASTGRVLELSTTAYDDDGLPLRRIRKLPFHDHGSTEPKTMDELNFVFEGGTAQSTDTTTQAGNPIMELSWRNEDRIWRPMSRKVPIGPVGEAGCVRRERSLGSYERRQLRYECSAPVPFGVSAIHESYTPGKG